MRLHFERAKIRGRCLFRRWLCRSGSATSPGSFALLARIKTKHKHIKQDTRAPTWTRVPLLVLVRHLVFSPAGLRGSLLHNTAWVNSATRPRENGGPGWLRADSPQRRKASGKTKCVCPLRGRVVKFIGVRRRMGGLAAALGRRYVSLRGRETAAGIRDPPRRPRLCLFLAFLPGSSESFCAAEQIPI